MPKSFYAAETDIPDNLKGAYEAKNGRWELTKLDDEHPVVATNKSLTTEQSRLKSQVTNLTTDKESAERERDEARNKTVPHGYRAVSKDVAEIGEAAKAAGLDKDNVGGLKTKVDEYEKEKTDGEKKALKTRAFQSAGVANTNLALSLRQSDDLEFESETKDGKEIFYRVTEKDGKKEKTLFDSNYLKGADGFKDVFGQLVTKDKKTPFPGKETETTGSVFDRIREGEKKNSEPVARSVDQAFGFAQ